MYCPRCQGVQLNPITYQGVTIDKCPRCEGVWLDKGEEVFVNEILAHSKDACCDKCVYFDDSRKMCTRLKIYVERDFSCSNYIAK